MNHISKNRLTITLLVFAVVLSGCKKEKEPRVTTSEISTITQTDAIGGGNITDEGSSTVIARGLCWSISPNPTIADNKTSDGSGAGSFISDITGLIGNETYYARAYATNSEGTGYGMVISFTSFGESPAASTSYASNISATSATLIGVVNANNLTTAVSFEYGTTTNYGSTIAFTQTSVSGVEDSNVAVDIKGLIMATTYHFRIKAVNSLGTIFGSDLTFNTLLSDKEGHTYNTVTIGTQVWMQENLKATRYLNGELIGTLSIPSKDITLEISPKYQWECANAASGRYYTYYVITDDRKICPVGWHVPTDSEWTTLTDYLTNNGYGFGGSGNNIAKALAATSGYDADPTPGNVGNDQATNNKSGFTGLPSGGRYSNGSITFVGLHGIWWSSEASSETSALFRCIGYIPAKVFRGVFNKSYGLPVRCLKN